MATEDKNIPTQTAEGVPATVVQPAAAPVVVQQVVMPPIDPNGPPAGAPPGGTWTTENYSGTCTIVAVIVLVLLFWPAFAGPLCCPCDAREVYVVNGAKYTRSGAMVPPSDCCGHPCGGPAY